MKKWQIVLGIGLIVMGLFALVEALFNLNLGRFVGPLILIGIGLLLILRPRRAKTGVQVQMPILGDIRKTGNWEVTQHEIWSLIGDNHFDFRTATFPADEGVIKLIGFINEVEIILPDDVGLQIDMDAFVSELKLSEGKQERFLSRLSYQSPNFSEKEKRVIVQTLGFVSEMKVKAPIY